MTKKTITRSQFDALAFFAASIWSATESKFTSHDGVEGIMKRGHHKFASEAGMTVNDIIAFCENEANYHGFCFQYELKNWKEKFQAVAKHKDEILKYAETSI